MTACKFCGAAKTKPKAKAKFTFKCGTSLYEENGAELKRSRECELEVENRRLNQDLIATRACLTRKISENTELKKRVKFLEMTLQHISEMIPKPDGKTNKEEELLFLKMKKDELQREYDTRRREQKLKFRVSDLL